MGRGGDSRDNKPDRGSAESRKESAGLSVDRCTSKERFTLTWPEALSTLPLSVDSWNRSA